MELMRKVGLVATAAVLATGLSACRDKRALVDGHLKDYWGQISNSEVLRTRGIGAAPDGAYSPTRRRAASRNAALVAARYEMLGVIKGIRMVGGLTVGQSMQQDSTIQEVVNRVISGAEEVQTEWMADDGCVVTLELRRDKVDELLERDRPWEPTPPAAQPAAPPPQQSRAPSGVPREGLFAATTGESLDVFYDSQFPLHNPLDLLMPGWAQMAAGMGEADGAMSEQQASSLIGHGIGTMAGVLALAGGGGDVAARGRKAGNRQEESLGLLMSGAALALHVWGVVDANRAVAGRVAVVPERGGARLLVAGAF